jgi:hypothetical protein
VGTSSARLSFVLTRDFGRRFLPPRLTPRWLRPKWIGIVLFAVVLFCYEQFGLWALPRATAYSCSPTSRRRSSSI